MQDPATVERIRAMIAQVPIRIRPSGVSALDFAAYQRGERRPSPKPKEARA